ncbi:UNVERIFIED_CONTAM: hypothetical protein Sradi_3330200 [Sesamum radiatum]|uniref:Uncharacterized protein n=1 Tax=Sesamum radiatum TaxID=300843 RepID=A0AAW2R1P7_SESRA
MLPTRLRRDPCATHLMQSRGGILTGHTPILQQNHVMSDSVCARMGSHRMGSTGSMYSCWPIILTPYNLPLGMCMSSEYMFMTMVIPSPSNPKHLIDIYLELLIKELQNLWHMGAQTRDGAKDETFMMRAALMWTMNHLPTYGTASGWSTVDVMGCPICMKDTRAFYLQNGRKACYFDCHKQFLPPDHPYHRNKKAFTKNRVERKVARPRLTGEQIRDWVEEFSVAVEGPLSLPDGYDYVYWYAYCTTWLGLRSTLAAFGGVAVFRPPPPAPLTPPSAAPQTRDGVGPSISASAPKYTPE